MLNSRRGGAALSCAVFVCGTLAASLAYAQPKKADADPGMEVLHGAHIMHARSGLRTSGSAQLVYQGGFNGTGVIAAPAGTAPTVYLVYWGTQWFNNDRSGEAAIQQAFFNAVGGSAWNNSVTQYCQGVATGTVSCGSKGTAATNALLNVVVWYDNAGPAPSHPTQSQIAAEAVRTALVFGNTTPAANTVAQYVINTATGNSSRGFGTQYCAYHSATSSSYGTIAYTNMPYITDAGASCGANFNGLGPNAGITIVGGHEFAETESDIYPNTGWLDKNGAENGDKCAWVSTGQGAAARVALTSTATFPVQSLWSNAFNSGAGGCVQAY